MTDQPEHQASLFFLLQLASPALPVGAFSYSEGLETLVYSGAIANAASLQDWLTQELSYGAIRLEAAVVARVHSAAVSNDLEAIARWNHWLSGLRETQEMRDQSWQMGRALTRLVTELQPSVEEQVKACGDRCNFAIAFAIAAARWGIDCPAAVSGYLHSWLANMINSGVKLIPLGQTQGQQVLMQLYPQLSQTVADCQSLQDDDFYSCGWGLAIASMTHETLYSRLFRS